MVAFLAFRLPLGLSESFRLLKRGRNIRQPETITRVPYGLLASRALAPKTTDGIFRLPMAYAIPANTSAAMAIVSSTNSAVCAADIKLASYADGPNATPRSNSPWKKVLNAAMLDAAMSL